MSAWPPKVDITPERPKTTRDEPKAGVQPLGSQSAMLAPQLASSWTLSEIGRVRRRDFIKAIAGSAATLPLVARAQQLQMPVIGYLSSRSEQPDAPLVSAFRQGLVESGNVGKSVKI